MACAIFGGLVGLLIIAAFDPRGQAMDMDVIAVVVGALFAVGINRLLRG